MAITGHKSVSEVSRYTKAAEQSRLAEQAFEKARTKGVDNCPTTTTRLEKGL